MPVFDVRGKEVHVEPYTTWWPLSIVFKQQGVEIKINPDRHWWCLWLCTTTDDVENIGCTIELQSTVIPTEVVVGTCNNCGDLTVNSAGQWGISGPWPFQRVDFQGTIQVDGERGSFKGSILFS
jgi:hypothetical protein